MPLRRSRQTLNDRTLTVQVSVSEQQYLDGLSRISGLSMSALLRELVRGFIKRVPPEQLTKKLESS